MVHLAAPAPRLPDNTVPYDDITRLGLEQASQPTIDRLSAIIRKEAPSLNRALAPRFELRSYHILHDPLSGKTVIAFEAPYDLQYHHGAIALGDELEALNGRIKPEAERIGRSYGVCVLGFVNGYV